ncbi:Protein CBG08890 [Caenorhabditis briggsae]|uniref:Protein CBG08890 n=1 Tax=Caenorhabditis briggsae TaxID=6238 RepID=A8X7M3_CAEBR|nr:Protein CBG08890 [Caenorhabditis briggsae]CAP28634.1 Protein CBG08890 [Caenorhabditis briggsae]
MKILLLFSAFAVAVNAVQWSELDFYNMLRRDFAKTNAIPDMWKLTWDKKLEVLANKFDCNDKAVRKNYRYFLTDGSPRNESKIVDADTLNWMIETEKTNPAELTNTVKEWEKTTARFFDTKLGFYPPVDQHSGKIPGSQCGPNGKNDDGLCVPK